MCAFVCVCVCSCVYLYVCVCVCLRERKQERVRKCVTSLIHMCDIAHSYVCPDSFICVT